MLLSTLYAESMHFHLTPYAPAGKIALTSKTSNHFASVLFIWKSYQIQAFYWVNEKNTIFFNLENKEEKIVKNHVNWCQYGVYAQIMLDYNQHTSNA